MLNLVNDRHRSRDEARSYGLRPNREPISTHLGVRKPYVISAPLGKVITVPPRGVSKSADPIRNPGNILLLLTLCIPTKPSYIQRDVYSGRRDNTGPSFNPFAGDVLPNTCNAATVAPSLRNIAR